MKTILINEQDVLTYFEKSEAVEKQYSEDLKGYEINYKKPMKKYLVILIANIIICIAVNYALNGDSLLHDFIFATYVPFCFFESILLLSWFNMLHTQDEITALYIAINNEHDLSIASVKSKAYEGSYKFLSHAKVKKWRPAEPMIGIDIIKQIIYVPCYIPKVSEMDNFKIGYKIVYKGEK